MECSKVFFSFLTLFIFCQAEAAKQIVVASYNVENLFDTEHDEGKEDIEYTPGGTANWTPEKLELKLNQIVKSIRAINDGKGPDVLAIPETENMNVLKMLNAKLADLHYTAVLLEGPDVRGIDVGFLTKFPLARTPHMYQVSDSTWPRPTRPVYEVVVQASAKTQVTLLLNHWPSRMNPPELRCKAALVLKQVFKLHADKEPDMPVIAMGDFNDEPEDISVSKCLGTGTIDQTMSSEKEKPLFFDSYLEKNSSREVRSTYYFSRNKEWDGIDHIIMSKSALKGAHIHYVLNSFKNIRNEITVSKVPVKGPNGKMIPPGAPIPFTPSSDMSGAIGASDHLPVRAVFEIE